MKHKLIGVMLTLIISILVASSPIEAQTIKLYILTNQDTTINIQDVLEFNDTVVTEKAAFILGDVLLAKIEQYFKDNNIPKVCNNNWLKINDKYKGSVYYTLRRLNNKNLYYLKIW